jgi:hypothetical protein
MRAFLLVLILAVPVFAQFDGNPENWCREGFFTRDNDEFGTARVKGSQNGKAYFYSDDEEDCPAAERCRRNSYLVGRDEVVVNGRSFNGFACVWYSPLSGRPTVGWVRERDLVVSPKLSDVTMRTWLGEWVYGDNGIEFTENKLSGYLNVTGNATWKGIKDNVHVGEIDGRYKPTNGWIDYSDGDAEHDCRMRMRLIGDYLIVADNLKCGGVNVTFSGVYTKRKK